MDYTNGWVRRKGRRTSIGWPKVEKGRRETSTKLPIFIYCSDANIVVIKESTGALNHRP
jgi:hypothetical protein